MTNKTRSLRMRASAEMLGISVPTLYRWIKEKPDFPRPRQLSARCTVLDQEELVAWRDAQAVLPNCLSKENAA